MNSAKGKFELRREIEKKISAFTPSELFASPYFQEMLQATVNSVCEKLKRVPTVKCHCNPTGSDTAATDGEVISLNTLGPLIRELPTNWERYVSNIGHAVHEAGHVLFTDFYYSGMRRNGWQKMPPTFFPVIKSKEAERVAELFSHKPNFAAEYCAFMSAVENVLEDGYIERRLREHFSGLAVAGLEKANSEIYRRMESLNARLKRILAGEMKPYQLAYDLLLLSEVVGKKPKTEGPLTEEEQAVYERVTEVLNDNKKVIAKLHKETKPITRSELFNDLFIGLLPLFPPPEEDETKNESSQNQDLLSQQANNSGASQSPKGTKLPIQVETSEYDEEESRAGGQSLSDSSESLERELNRAMKNAAEASVRAEAEKAHRKQIEKETKENRMEHLNIPEGTTFRGYHVERSYGDSAAYRWLFRDIERTGNNLIRKINNILKEREDDSSESGYLTGSRFNAADVVNGDGKYFSRPLVPDGKPKVVFGIVVDESGSMAGVKIERAKRAAILLEYVLRKLEVPLILVGHSESDEYCDIFHYVDFDTVDNRDCFRLTDIKAKLGNIDGAVISYVGDRLAKRVEERKVLIVISDGLPAGSSFYATSYEKDTLLSIEHYRKKGILVFGALVDEVESVSKLYGASYCFDCRQDKALENELVRLIKRYVVY